VTANATVLVVDDLPQNIRLLEAVLAPRGYEVVAAQSGAEALERVAAGGVDLVLLDILMPGMDGYEVCRRLRADDASRFLPVVMITASGEQEKLAAIEAGADDLLAIRPQRAARSRPVAFANQGVPRHDRRAGSRARGVQP
jgi:adenylate cyclase